MTFTCSVAKCRNAKRAAENNNDLTFHRFPVKNKTLCQVWVTRCQRKDKINVKNARVCSDHFVHTDYERDLQNELLGLPQKKILKPEAVPRKMNLKSDTGEKNVSTRAMRMNERARKDLVQILLQNEETSDDPVKIGK